MEPTARLLCCEKEAEQKSIIVFEDAVEQEMRCSVCEKEWVNVFNFKETEER